MGSGEEPIATRRQRLGKPAELMVEPGGRIYGRLIYGESPGAGIVCRTVTALKIRLPRSRQEWVVRLRQPSRECGFVGVNPLRSGHEK